MRTVMAKAMHGVARSFGLGLCGLGLCGLASIGLIGYVSLSAQQAPRPDEGQEPLRLRIGVTAVEIDAVVTKDGRPVTDLRADEFEIYQDGRKQTVVSAHYVPLERPNASGETTTTTSASAARSELTRDEASSLPPARGPRREDIRHTMAIIVDDLNLSFASSVRVRDALDRFVRRDLRDGDLVSILRTGRGVGRFQPFTTDKRVLLTLASNLQFNLSYETPFGVNQIGEPSDGPFDTLDSLRRDTLMAGSLGAVSAVIRGMRDMPGRKSVLLVSDGWSPVYYPRPGRDEARGGSFTGAQLPHVQPRIQAAMRRLVDEANRSFVVIYTLDARGVQGPELYLSESQPPTPAEAAYDAATAFESHTGPRELADLGGGLYLRGNNDLARQMTRAMEDQRGYYLIGYEPDGETFTKDADARARFHGVKVRVTRPDLKVRARRGFFGVTDEELAPAAPRTREDRLLRALHHPFAAGDIALEAAGLFWRHPSRGGMVRALLTLDSSALTFDPDESGGGASATVEVYAALIDERGVPASSRTLTLSAPRPATGVADGRLVYAIDLPIDQAGPFQLRAAVRDVRADREGSAAEFVLVPETRSARLALSGVMLAGAPVFGLATAPATDAEARADVGASSGRSRGADEDQPASPASLNPVRPEAADPVRRRFEPGMAVDYAYQVYNAERDPATGRPALASSFRLFRDGRLVLDGPLDPAVSDAPGDSLARRKTALSVGRITLAGDLMPGDYDLEVAVSDRLAKKRARQPAAQWTSFTVTPRPSSAAGVPGSRGR